MRHIRFLPLLLLGFPSLAFAHAFGQQFVLPLPLHYFLGGGMLAFVISCVILLFFSTPGDTRDHTKTYTFRGAGFLRVILGLIGICLLALCIALGFFGSENFTQNPLSNLFWVLFLILFVYISAIAGGLWPHIDPFQKIARLFAPEVHSVSTRMIPYVPVLLLYGLLWVELFSGWGYVPRIIGTLFVLYLFLTILMSFLFGAKNWFEKGDLFSTFFGLASRMAPMRLEGNKVHLSLPGEQLVRESMPHTATLLFIFVLLGSTIYDGLRETHAWWNVIFALNLTNSFVFYSTGILTLVLLPFILFGLYALAIWGMKKLTGSPESVLSLSLLFGYSLVPIAIAYHFAHYFSLVLIQGQVALAQISDPFSLGWNLFGTAANKINISLIGADTIWYLQLLAIVLGHILAAVVAHRIALKTFKTRSHVVLSQLPMLVLMVFFTAFGLWTLAQPFIVR